MNLRRHVHWWLSGTALGAAVLGPGLHPGSLLSLDLVLTPHLQVPPGAWGLGPELPQRVPLGIPLAWLAALTTGPVAGKALLIASFAVAFVGAARLVRHLPLPTQVGAGLLYAASPFALTRAGAGHLNVLGAYALLPFALPRLVRPSHWRAAFLAGGALALTGSAGGSLAIVAVAVAVATGRDRPTLTAAAAALAAQALWVVPNVVALASGATVARASAFPTRAGGWRLLGLFAGDGFWRAANQVGSDTLLAVAGTVLLALALYGHRSLPARWRSRLAGLAAVGFAIAAASAVPGFRWAFDHLTGTPLGTPFREGQRALALYLAWALPAAAAGTAAIARRVGPTWQPVAAVSAVALALPLAGPGAWGIGGRLEPVTFPSGWSAARERIALAPGTVLALPWHEYLDLSFAGGRRVLNPLPSFLGGDVLSSFNPEFGGMLAQEQTDRRSAGIDELVFRIARERPVAAELATLGIRWVVLLHEVNWETYDGLTSDPGLEHIDTGSGLDLYRVRAWRGPLVDATGRPAVGSSPVRPLLRIRSDEALAWQRPSGPGWLRGWQHVPIGPDGLLVIPPGGGPVWFWPAVPVVLVDVLVAGVAAIVLIRETRTRIRAACGRRIIAEGSLAE